MRFEDLLRLCAENLLRRLSRTLLTVLGVVIGCCSIVIMISIGIGMRESQARMLAQMGDLTIITVYGGSGAQKRAKLNAAAVSRFKKMEGVEAATPKISADELSVKLYAGENRRFVCEYTSIAGIESAAMEKLGYKFLEGESIRDAQKDAVCGQYFAYAFKDTLRPEGYNTVDLYSMYQPDGTIGEPPEPYFSPQDMALTLEISLGSEAGAKKLSFPLNVKGVVKEDYAKGYETSQGLILDFKTLSDMIDQYKRGSGKPTTPDASYPTVIVKADDISHVAQIEKEIKARGFQTSSMESIREPMEKEAKQKQLMLAGLGAISLFVAALGITNTMIMSISERTKEIGVMKALGCYVRDIRAMFLTEAAMIGLCGGVAGSLLSLLISFLLNSFASGALNLGGMGGGGDGGAISVVPFWLLAFAVLFSIGIGLISGYYPANKAVRIPVLEAIRDE